MSVMTKEEFAREVRGYTLHMYRLAYSILNNSTDAEDAVMQLDGGYRDVIVLFYYEQCTIPEISRILECRQGTVKSRLYRAKEQLRERLM